MNNIKVRNIVYFTIDAVGKCIISGDDSCASCAVVLNTALQPSDPPVRDTKTVITTVNQKFRRIC